VPVESDTATFMRVRDGAIVELRGYMDRGAALAALRL
jgi:ketosteroid isomerase-like protein